MIALGGEASGRWLSHGGEASQMGLVPLEEETWEQAHPLSTMRGHNEKLAVCNPEEGPCWNPTILAPWSWISHLQNCEK